MTPTADEIAAEIKAGLRFRLEREDLDDGSITYHLWDSDHEWIIGLNDADDQQGGKAKRYAELIVRAVNSYEAQRAEIAARDALIAEAREVASDALKAIREMQLGISIDNDRGNRGRIEGPVVTQLNQAANKLDAFLSPPMAEPRRGIYIASKTAHARRWRILRDKIGYPIISTWIDEAGPGESKDLADLWRRCIAEASSAEVLVLNREGDEVLKGGWVELGAALASGVPVLAVGIEEFTVAHDQRIRHFASIPEVMTYLKPMCNGVRFDALPTPPTAGGE